MPRTLILVLTLVAVPLQASSLAADGLDPARIDQEFRALLEAQSVPGAAWAIVRGGQIEHVAGFGVRRAGSEQPVTATTAFRLASVSKTFAAQLTAQLVAEGRLHWNDPVRQFVPEFTLARPEHARALTLEHLLGQSVGVVPNAYDNLLNAGRSLDEILPRFSVVESVCAPGQCYTYQNVMFSLVGPAIEKSTSRRYDELLRERLFEPLDMRQASVGLSGYETTADRAAPHVRVKRLRWLPTEVNENYYRVAPAAGVNASALDLGHWLVAQLGYRPDIIAPAQLDELTRKRVRTSRELRRKGWRDFLSDAHYGLGWRIYSVDGQELVTHSGWVSGFVAQVAYSPAHDTGLALLLNAESGVINDLSLHFWKQVFANEPPLSASAPDRATTGAAAATVLSE